MVIQGGGGIVQFDGYIDEVRISNVEDPFVGQVFYIKMTRYFQCTLIQATELFI